MVIKPEVIIFLLVFENEIFFYKFAQKYCMLSILLEQFKLVCVLDIGFSFHINSRVEHVKQFWLGVWDSLYVDIICKLLLDWTSFQIIFVSALMIKFLTTLQCAPKSPRNFWLLYCRQLEEGLFDKIILILQFENCMYKFNLSFKHFLRNFPIFSSEFCNEFGEK